VNQYKAFSIVFWEEIQLECSSKLGLGSRFWLGSEKVNMPNRRRKMRIFMTGGYIKSPSAS
jgi:hypothetical protein